MYTAKAEGVWLWSTYFRRAKRIRVGSAKFGNCSAIVHRDHRLLPPLGLDVNNDTQSSSVSLLRWLVHHVY